MPDPIQKISLSRYAERLLVARPELLEELRDPQPFRRAAMAAALAATREADEPGLKAALRRLRQRVLLRVMARDLIGNADLDEVCASMSDLAELSIDAALEWVEARLGTEYGVAHDGAGRPQRLIVVGMGKLGGRELNVSSDVDLVFVYPGQGETAGPRRVSAQEYFERAGRKLIALLAEPTEDGFVFRVDMRLRPYGDSGPLALSFDALENYFVAHGRDWERYAWIKARALTGGGPGHAGDERHAELEAILRPFVFRRYLDYASLAAMRRLHAEVRRDVERRELIDHVKLGPGGIREVEFIAQALQLVRGGRDPALTVRPTREALARLAERRLLAADAARELSAAYVQLREVEHRLQYLDDLQTHSLPEAPDDRSRIAAMSGCASWEAFAQQFAAVRDTVSRHFSAVFAESSAAELSGVNAWASVWSEDREAAAQLLAERGFRDAAASASRLAAARSSQRYSTLPAESRQRFDALVPALAAAAAATADPDATLARGLDLIDAIARRASYLALLAEHPEALERVVKMIAASSWAADFVTRHPLLLDELLDDRVLYAEPDWPEFERELRTALAAAASDTELQMNLAREHHHALLFRLLAQDLAGLLTVEKLADHLSQLADIVLAATLQSVWAQIPGRHREQPAFAVTGYGKLGGKELGYASDLDITFLYQDADERAEQSYLRLATRYNNFLSARTTSGTLFETDLALRPSGSKGLLVSSLSGFEQYQESSAWIWEHQALTRARYCAGDRDIGAAFEAIRARILTRSREPAPLAGEILAMREKMHAAHPNRSGLFDLKHDRGGMIDIEFMVQFLVLAHACRHPSLTGNLGNIALLRIAGELSLIAPQAALQAGDAYRDFRRMQHRLRLSGAQYARVPAETVAGHVQAVRELWELVFSSYR